MHLTPNSCVVSLLKMLIRQNVLRTALLRRLTLAEHFNLKRSDAKSR